MDTDNPSRRKKYCFSCGSFRIKVIEVGDVFSIECLDCKSHGYFIRRSADEKY